MKLKYFKEADLELRQFENFDRFEYFYESHADIYRDRKGSMIPFGLRMLAAELPQYLNRPEESVSMLCRLLDIVNSVIGSDLSSVAREVWHERKQKCQFSLVNILISRKVSRKFSKS